VAQSVLAGCVLNDQGSIPSRSGDHSLCHYIQTSPEAHTTFCLVGIVRTFVGGKTVHVCPVPMLKMCETVRTSSPLYSAWPIAVFQTWDHFHPITLINKLQGYNWDNLLKFHCC
jgi:hypothetical protein